MAALKYKKPEWQVKSIVTKEEKKILWKKLIDFESTSKKNKGKNTGNEK